MKIKYDVTVEDAVEFARYHFEHSPYFRATRRKALWLGSAALMGPTTLFAWIESDPVALTFGVLGTVAFLAIAPWSWRWSQARQLKRLYGEGQNKHMTGPRELKLHVGGLTETFAYGVQSAAFEALERIATTDSHAFFYIGAVQAFVIPRERVVEGDLDDFLEGVGNALAAARLNEARKRSTRG